MRRMIDLLSITVLITSPIALGVVYAQSSASQAVAQPTEAITKKNFPLNKAQEINFEPNEGFDKLTKRQEVDQLRDWLLITVLSGKGLSSEQISQGVYDLPTMRYDFMSPVANFEYGTTRSRYIGDGKVVALVPKTTKPEQRMDDLAHIADRNRKDQGEKPKIIEVYEYEITPDKQSALVTRRESINGEQLFSSAYGYYETILNSQDDLQRFLNQANDITFAQINGYSLTVGGRKTRKYQGVRVEDIAALWQSEEKIESSLREFQQRLEDKLISLPPSEQEKALQQAIIEGRKQGRLVNGSGFSLDWEYDYRSLEQALDNVKPLLKSIKLDGKPVISQQDIQQTKQGLSRKDINPYFQLINNLEKFWESDELVSKAFKQGELAVEIEQELKIYSEKKERENQDIIQHKAEQYQKQIQLELETAKQLGASAEEINTLTGAKNQQKEDKLKQWKEYLEATKNEEIYRKRYEIKNRKYKEISNFLNLEEKTGFQFARYDGGLQGTEVGMVLFYTDLLMKIWSFNFENSTVETGIEGFQPKTKIPLSSIYQQELKKTTSFTRLWFEPNDKGFQVANGNSDIIFAPTATRIKAVSSKNPQAQQETNALADTTAFLNWWNNHYEEVARHEPQYEKLNQIMKWSLVVKWLNQYQQSNPLSFLRGVYVKRDNWFPNWAREQGDRLKFRKWDKNTIQFLSEGYKYRGKKTEALKFLRSEKIDKRYGKPYPYIYGGVSLARPSDLKNPIPPSSTKLGKLSRGSIDYKSVKVQKGEVSFKTLGGTAYKVKPVSKTVSETIAEAKPEAQLRSLNAELTKQPFSSKITQTPDGLKLENAIGDTQFSNLNINKTANGFKVGFESRDIDTGYSFASRLSKYKGNSIPTALGEMDDVVSVRYSPSQPNDYYVKLSQSNKWLKISEGGSGGKPPSKRLMAVGEPDDGARNFNLEWLDDAQVAQQTKGFQKFSGKGANYQPPSSTRQKAQKLVEDYHNYIAATKIDLRLQIQKIDASLKVGDYSNAAKLINKSIQLHGKEPNLMLRKAAVDWHQGRLKIEIMTPEGAKPINQNFFDEINNRNFRAIETDKEFIYVHDSPGLNNLNFHNPIVQSVPFHSGARLYKLQAGAIGKVQLGQSGFGDVSASSNASTQFQGSNIGNSLNIRFQNSPQRFISNNECQEEDEKDKNENTNCRPPEKPVYVVTASEVN